jgi:hypothetical protein
VSGLWKAFKAARRELKFSKQEGVGWMIAWCWACSALKRKVGTSQSELAVNDGVGRPTESATEKKTTYF